MKIKNVLYLSLLLAVSSCRSLDQNSRTFIGVQTGSMIGNIAGTIIGDRVGGYTGAVIGSALGTTTGAVTGAIITSPRDNTPSSRPAAIPHGPKLYIDQILLNDPNKNKIVETGETCKLTFLIVNEGNQDAIGVIPVIKGIKNTKGLQLSEPLTIERIQPEELVEYTVTLTAGSQLKNGEAKFSIELKERNGYEIPAEEFTIKTRKIK